jgi:chitodextrinase
MLAHSVQASAPTNGLVGYWSFGEGSGTIATDSSGSGNDGILMNGPVWTTGKIGQGLNFDGVDDRIELATDSIGVGTATVCTWIYPTVLDSFSRSVVGNSRFHFGLYPANNALQVTSDTSASSGLVVNSVIAANAWTHVCAVRNSGTSGPTSLYVNSAFVGSGNSSTPTTGAGLTIGSHGPYAEQQWKGLIDDVRIYNRALSAVEISDVYNDLGPPDTIPPTIPTSLTATPTSSTQINLSWTASSDAVGVTGYRVERCQGSGCTTFAQIATPTTTSYSDTTLTASATYSYRIRAIDAAGNLSGYSANASATTQAPIDDTTAPSTPTNLIATPISSSQINLSWTASIDNVVVTGYKIFRSGVQVGTSVTTSYSDSGLTAATLYSYTVSANDAAGNNSIQSNGANTTTQSTSGCTGSGLSWNCAPGATVAQIQAAITSSSDGAIITFANGKYTWNSHISLNNKNGITLICESVRGCDVAFSGDVLGIDATPFVVTELIRISGFVFTGSPGSAALWFLGDRNINKLRIDNNTFRNFPSGYIAIMVGGIDSWITGYVYGVIDHNIFTGNNSFMAVKALTGKSWPIGLAGSANNIFLEDNTATFSISPDYGGWVDSWTATGIVVRYNNLTNVRITSHGAGHGGPANTEWYGNTVSSPTTANYRNMHHQGSGEIMIFNNTITGGHMALLDYRSDVTQLPNGSAGVNNVCDGTQTGVWPDGNRLPITTYRGYPCWHQPGRDNNLTLKPVYLWGNKNESNTLASVSIESGGYVANHLLVNRDYYEAISATAQTSPTSPFNGTYGVGFGTFANRPTICSVGLTDSADAGNGGVGYFAIDVGSQGTLYRCASPNMWVAHYTPYTYPHPLVSGSILPPPPPDTTAPTTPTSLTATPFSTTQINLSWTASSDNVGVTGYRIYRNGTQITTTTTNTYSNTGLTASTTYTYTVSAYDGAGNTSTQSGGASATTQAGAGGTFTIPTARRTTWQGNVGIPGGIPTTYTNCVTTACNTLYGGTVTVASINAALASAPNDTVVRIPAGTYSINGTISFQGLTNVILRGSGMTSTVLNNSSASPNIGTGDMGMLASGRSITGGATKGATSITSSNVSGVTIGSLLYVSQTNPSYVRACTIGGQYLMSQAVTVTSVVGSTVNFTPALMTDFSLSPVYAYTQPSATNVGLENLTVNSTAGPNNTMNIWWADQVWVKGVKISGYVDTGIFVLNSSRVEIQKNYIYATAATHADGYGVQLRSYEPGTASNSLIENNLFDGGPGAYLRNFMNDGGTSNVFAYNYVTHNSQGIDQWQFPGIFTNHKPHGAFNLYEGNIVNGIQSDGYHGSASHDTLFRNDFTGAAPWLTGGADGGARKPVDLNRWTTYYNVVGNILGSPSWNPVSYMMTGEPGYYEQPTIYRLGYPNAGNNSLTDGVGCTAPANFDPNVQATLLRQKNYDYFNDTQRVCGSESEGCQGATNVAVSDTLPDSLYLTSKPAWFGTLAWPPVNSATPSVGDIPAKVFYNTGAWSGEVAPPTDTTPSTVSMTAPLASATVSGSTAVSATASDNVSVVGVQFLLDGSNLGTEDTTAPYSITWDTTSATNAAHTLTARARDAAGNQTTSASVTVTVSNTITPPSTRFSLNDRVQVTIGTLNVRSTASTAGTLLGQQPVGALGTVIGGPTAANGFIWWNVNYDTAPDGWSVEDNLLAYTAPTADTTIPTTPTSLSASAFSSTQINLSWTASSDNVGVAGYRIYRNGTQITTTTTTAYSNTTLSPSTSYTYTIAAYDAAGNASAQSASASGSTQSAPIVTITPPPPSPPLTTSNTPPASGATGSISTTPTTPTTIPTVSTPATPSTPTPPSTPTSALSLTRNLYRGTKGTDVQSLQSFLIHQGHLAPTNNTGFYGPLTKQAVEKYQCAQSLVCSGTEVSTGYGVVGPKTRASLNTGTVGAGTTTSFTTNLTPAQVDAILSVLESFGAEQAIIEQVRRSLGR